MQREKRIGATLIDGGLLTRNFLIEGISTTAQWSAIDSGAIAEIKARAGDLFTKLLTIKNPNEAVTEKDLIYPLLSAIGWDDLVHVQPNASVKGRKDVPDALLFADDTAHSRARSESDDWKRFQHGLCLVEAKRWGRVLDREEKGPRADDGVPSTQMLRYLRRVDDVTKGGLRWGILTNGRIWRLYWQGALSVAEDYFEVDLGKVLDLPGCDPDLLDKRPDVFADNPAWRDHVFKLFVLLFRRDAFLPFDAGQTFHDHALKEGKFWESRVARTLADTVFRDVFPALADALAKTDPARQPALPAAYLEQVRQGALILLYRLLFVLYAEDRNLLPDESGPYADYSLTRMRLDIAARKSAGKPISATFTTYWPKLVSIFRAIADGDDGLGIPPYNGGLFDPAAAPILSRVQLPDGIVADVIFGLSHERDSGTGRGAKYINYRDLSVQQLGSVYERILEFGLRARSDGGIEIDADDEARHESGSYYTPEDLVTLIIERAVGPLIAELHAAFAAEADRLKNSKGSVEERLGKLMASDPAAAILSLKICDPAMGSGHFLVSFVDWLADEVLDAMAEAPAIVTWGDYKPPLADRIRAVREKILSEAKAHKWPIVESQLDDRHVVRRMVLKRVVHGVDKNPMAVELAKVSLWLHSFTAGAPLSYLDHHLRAGDSILGAWVRPTIDALQSRGALFNIGQIARVEQMSGLMAEIEQITDNDIAEIASSKSKFSAVEEATNPIAALFSLLTAEQLMGVLDSEPRRVREPSAELRKRGIMGRKLDQVIAQEIAFDRAQAVKQLLDGTYGDPLALAEGAQLTHRGQGASASTGDPLLPLATGLRDEMLGLDRSHRFFHWEIGFPNVWSSLVSNEPDGGFDAVIGNPPYVRQELLGDQVKGGLKKNYAAYDGMADLYVYFYEQGLKLLKPGGRMSYVVTNKWLKAGYAEALRDLFATKGWLAFVADFGHAKHFFPDADVFPSVLVVRKPVRGIPDPVEADVCVIPRDEVPRKGLSEAVGEATFPLPRAMFTKESWVLEPKPVMDLLDKIRRNGSPLAEYAEVKPLYGIKTGFNEAFLISAQEREELVRLDPACGDLIKPYLRGQDIERWWSPDSGLFMIVLKSSGNFAWPWANASNESEAEAIFERTFPALHRRMKRFESFIDKKSGKAAGLRHREDQGKFWWELRACDYYDAFSRPKITYQVIQFYPSYSFDTEGRFGNDKTFFLPTDSSLIGSVLNSPLLWWFNWRHFTHLKDEALSPMAYRVEQIPIAQTSEVMQVSIDSLANKLISERRSRVTMNISVVDWLHHEYDLDKPGSALMQSHQFDADAFAAAVRKALPRSRKLSASDIARLKQEHAQTVEPARLAANEALALERKLSDLVNDAYGLTADDVRLMWSTAPPRMPFAMNDNL